MNVTDEQIRKDPEVQKQEEYIVVNSGGDIEYLFTKQGRDAMAKLTNTRVAAALRLNRESKP